MHEYFAFMYVYASCLCTFRHWKRTLDTLELEFIDGCEIPYGYWELNLGPL